MTFEQFQDTRRYTDNLGEDVGNPSLGSTTPGITYLHNLLYIEAVTDRWSTRAQQEGRYYLCIESEEWISHDLEALERHLYEYAVKYELIEKRDAPRVAVN